MRTSGKIVLALSLLLNVGLLSLLAVHPVRRAIYHHWLPQVQSYVLSLARLPGRLLNGVGAASPVGYDFSYRTSAEELRYEADRPRQITFTGYGASGERMDPELRLRADFPEGSAFPSELVDRYIRRLRRVDSTAYLKGILDGLGLDRLRSDREKVERVVAFAQEAVRHDPIVSPPTYDPVFILEAHKGRCGQVNYQVAPALLNLAGFKTRRVKLYGHAALEVWYEGGWHYYDTDMLKGGTFIRRPDGSVPDAAWLTTLPNYYLVDTYPTWTEAYAYGGAPVNVAGKRVTGTTGIGNPEILGYPSHRFGAPLAYPPSPPELEATEVHARVPRVTLRWGGSYDGDHDFLHYRLEVGTAPGKADVTVLRTERPAGTVTLPRPGTYFYRVRAVDRHVEVEPNTFYVPSEEGKIAYDPGGRSGGSEPSIASGWPVPRGIARLARRILDAASFDDGSLGGFRQIQADANAEETRLFNVDWFGGRALKMVDLSDDQFPSGSVEGARGQTLVFRRWLATPQAEEASVVSFDLYLEKRGYGGVHPFSIVELGRGDGRAERLALVIDPDKDELRLTALGPSEATAEIRPKYWVSYRSEWRHSLNGPEVFWLPPPAGGADGQTLGALRLGTRNAWRFDLLREGRRLVIFANGARLGEVEAPGAPRWIALRSNPVDEVVYVFGNLRVWQ